MELAIANSEMVKTNSETGAQTFSFSTVRAAFKAQGYSGKELSRKVNDYMDRQQGMLAAGVAGAVTENGYIIKSVRTTKAGDIVVTHGAPKAERVSKTEALKAEIAKRDEMLVALEAKVNALLAAQSSKAVAESAPEEAGAMTQALEAAGL